MNVADFDQSGLFGDKEDVTFEEEEIALNRLEVGLETRVSVSARRCLGYIVKLIQSRHTFGSFQTQ